MPKLKEGDTIQFPLPRRGCTNGTRYKTMDKVGYLISLKITKKIEGLDIVIYLL